MIGLDDLSARMSLLLEQLFGSGYTFGPESLARVVAHPANRLLVASTDGGIVGTATVVLLETLRGAHARLEDVVVDERARGRGVGTALTHAALDLATQAAAVHVELTSRPYREAARRLYQHLGFERVETDVFRYHFPPSPTP